MGYPHLVAAVLLALAGRACPQDLLRDDFSVGLGKWKVRNPEAVQAAEGAVRLLPGGGLAAGDASWRDYVVSFRAQTVSSPPGDGHWGVHIRAVPGPADGELYIFARPVSLSVTGSGNTEWGFANAPPLDRLQEHRYRLTVSGSQVEIEVDGRLVGVAHGIANAAGGIIFSAYNVSVEIKDVVVTALAPEAAAQEPAIPLDLPPAEAALGSADPASRTERLDIVIYNPTGLRRENAPVVIPLDRIAFPQTPNLSSLVATDPGTGQPLPTQVDDLLGTGAIPPPDTLEGRYRPQLCFLATVEAYSARTIRLRFATGPGRYACPADGGMSVEVVGPKLTARTPVYLAEFDDQGHFTFQPTGLDRPFLSAKPPEQERLLCRRVGPVRALLITRWDVEENARVTRSIEAYPDHVHTRTILASADGKKDAFVSPVGGYYFDIGPLDAVGKMRYRTIDGFAEDPPGDPKPFEKLYATPTASSLDFVLPGTALAFVRSMTPEYAPGMALIGWHRYMSGGLAFGWRPPVQVTVDRPHAQDLWIAPHAGGMAEFSALDRACRAPLVMAEPAAIRERASERLHEAEALTEAAGLPGAPSALRLGSTAAAPLFAQAAKADDPLPAFLEGEKALARFDLASAALSVAQRLGDEVAEGMPADREVAPWRSLVGQARACAAAAAWDLALGHEARGVPRLARAATLYRAARAYATHASQPIVPQTSSQPLYPYVTFSEGGSPAQSFAGFDVGHFWVPWGNHFEQLELEPKPGKWNWAEADRLFGAASSAGMGVIPLLNFAPPRWWTAQFEPPKDAAGAPPGSTGDTRLVSPALLGRVPPHMEAFAEYIKQVASRYGSRGSVLAWSVRNEPAYYETGGLNGPLMREAFGNWIRHRYPTIAGLNANWGTSFPDFESLKPPERWEQNPAAWYDLMTFKAECLDGELSWEADLATANSPVPFTGAKFVPACSGPQSARSGYGVDPWLTAGAQRGVAFSDLYLDDERMSAIRAAELSWGAGGVPVVSCETGPSSRPVERVYRWHYYPDRRARSLPWMLLQFGLYGTHYWTWSTNEEYACLDWDGALCEFGLEAALANAEMRALRPALAGAMPQVDIGLLYPRASFVQGDREVIEAYQNLYLTLVQCGHQIRLVAPSDFDRVAATLSHLVVPPAPYLESSLVDGLRRYAENGGTLLLTGNSGQFDEYTRPRTDGLRGLTGARVASAEPVPASRLRLGGQTVSLPGGSPVMPLVPEGAQTQGSAAVGGQAAAPILTANRVGKGQVWWLGMSGFQAPGDGGRVPLPARWRFAFGDQWPQAAGQGSTTTLDHTDRGTAERWFAPDCDDSRWEEVRVPGVWEDAGHPDVDGWGWYRVRFTLPAEVQGKRLVLAGDTLDDRGRVYVNGALVQETTNWDAVWRVDITPQLRANGDNVLAIRVEDTCLLGGIRGNVALVCPDLPSPGEAVLPVVLQLAGASRTLSGGPTGVYRAVLSDKAGNRYLVVSNLSGSAADFDLTVYGAPKPTAAYVDLLTGQTLKARVQGRRLVLTLHLEPDGVRVTKL